MPQFATSDWLRSWLTSLKPDSTESGQFITVTLCWRCVAAITVACGEADDQFIGSGGGCWAIIFTPESVIIH